MGTTQIPYATKSWNVTVGCTHAGMKGCDNCWARDLHQQRYMAKLNGKKVPQQYSRPFGEIVLRPDRLEEPLHWRNQQRIFVCSMSDLFHPLVPFDYINEVLSVIAVSRQHTFMIFTKRANRMLEYFKYLENEYREYEDLFYDTVHFMKYNLKKLEALEKNEDEYEKVYSDLERRAYPKWPLPNLRLIVSCSTQKELDENVPILLDIPAAVRGVSLEPLIEEVEISDSYLGSLSEIDDPVFGRSRNKYLTDEEFISGKYSTEFLDWIIIGAESGGNRRPCKTEWIRKIAKQCQAANVACYVKQLDIDGKVITDPNKFPKDLQLRQMPKD